MRSQDRLQRGRGLGHFGDQVVDPGQGAQNITVCDTTGVVYQGRGKGMNPIKEELAAITNPDRQQGFLADALRGAEVFMGLSGPNVLTQDMVRSMAADPIVFALANPDPEIHPEAAKAAGALVVATGRSDFPNQVNNLAFPASSGAPWTSGLGASTMP